MKNYISRNIAFLLSKEGLSQSEFGAICGSTNATVSNWLKEKANPPIDKIQKICNHFSLKIDDFVNEDLVELEHQNPALDNWVRETNPELYSRIKGKGELNVETIDNLIPIGKDYITKHDIAKLVRFLLDYDEQIKIEPLFNLYRKTIKSELEKELLRDELFKRLNN